MLQLSISLGVDIIRLLVEFCLFCSKKSSLLQYDEISYRLKIEFPSL